MRKSLLSLGLFMSLSAGMASAQSVLVSDNINVPVGDQNHMFIKSFSETSEGYNFESGTGYYSNEIGQKTQRWWYRMSVT